MRKEEGPKKTSENIMFPQLDLRPDVPLIEICDNRRVLIENHRGITAYGNKEIAVKVKKGVVIVCGENLCIARMNRTKLVIAGSVCAVHIQKGNNNDHI